MLMRLIWLVGLTGLAAVAAPPSTAPPTPPAPILAEPGAPDPAAQAASFETWKADFAARARAAGHPGPAVDSILLGLSPDPRVEKHLTNQAEFTRPIWSYVQVRVNAFSIGRGKKALAANAKLFNGIEARYVAPREIVAAIWGVESGYGANTGDIDAPAALATMAVHGERRAFAERELNALITIVERDYADRKQLKGSWSGAMGHTQFIPTTYLERAVDFDGDGHRDFWTKPDDALASTAHFLQVAGWKRDEPWGVEVRALGLEALKLGDGQTRPLADFAKAGIARADSKAWTGADLNRPGRLFLPAGRNGPVFLTFSNFDAIKEYNRSESYALAVALLSDALAGRAAPITPWPTETAMLAPDSVRELQAGLAALGYAAGELDGKIGSQTRAALHAFQRDRDLPADGYPTAEALGQVKTALATAPAKP